MIDLLKMKQKLFIVIIILSIISCVGAIAKDLKQATDFDPPGPIITITAFPRNYQLYARNQMNKAFVEISGRVKGSIESLTIKVHKMKGVEVYKFSDVKNKFSLEVEIEALLHNYTIELYSKSSKGKEKLVKRATHVVAGDVYVLNGQSNAWAIDYDNKYNSVDFETDAKWIRTIGSMHVYNRKAILQEAENTEWFIASAKAPDIRNEKELVGKGMVGVLGYNIALDLIETEKIPIAIINGSGGGGAISFYQKTTNSDLNAPYGRLQFRLEHSGLKDKIKAFIWNQGENNAGDDIITYKAALSKLYGSFKSDYTFEKFYIIQTPPGCHSKSGHQTIREAQRQFAEETKDVHILTRHGISPDSKQLDGNYFMPDGCHYHAHGYKVLANWISNLARFDFYGATINYGAPKPVKVYIESPSSVIIEFNKNITLQPDLNVNGILYKANDNLFAINNDHNTSIYSIETIQGNSKKIRFTFDKGPVFKGDTLTYILNDNYPGTTTSYRGPWIVDSLTGVGAIGFTVQID